MYNFDDFNSRIGTDCIKWDDLISEYKCSDIIPMGIADMDFNVCDKIVDAINNVTKRGIYGYPTNACSLLGPIIADYYTKNKGLKCDKDDVVLGTGVVYQINQVIQLFTNENDSILLPAPYYPPFKNVVELNNRKLITTEMIIKDNQYILDMDDLEKKVDESCKFIIFCNPHNPTGRIFTRQELEDVVDFAQRHNLMIISDEIHSDFDFDNKFIPIASINEYARKNTFTFSSITKTFNLAGIKCSYGFIFNKENREKYISISKVTGMQSVNVFAIEALKACYTSCLDWKKQLLDYLKENRRIALQFIEKELKDVTCLKNDGTYLLWLDFTKTNLDLDNLHQYLIDHKVELNDGNMYSEKYKGYQRMNIALPRKNLLEALKRIKEAVNND